MAQSPGNYDEICIYVRELMKADAAVLLINNGVHGNGFSVQAPPNLAASLPLVLTETADVVFNALVGDTSLRDRWWGNLSDTDRRYWLAFARSTAEQSAWVSWLRRLNKRGMQ